MSDVKVSSTPVATFTPKTEVSCINKPFNWTVNKMRTVDQLPADWKARKTEGSHVTWKTLAKDVANFVLGLVTALALTVFTFGIGGALLIREYIKQKENEIYALVKEEDAAAFDNILVPLANECRALHDSSEKLNEELKEKNDSLLEAQREHNRLNVELQLLTQTNTRTIDELNQKIANLTPEFEASNANIKSLNEQIENLTQEKNELAEKLKSDKTHIDRWKTAANNYSNEMIALAKHYTHVVPHDISSADYRMLALTSFQLDPKEHFENEATIIRTYIDIQHDLNKTIPNTDEIKEIGNTVNSENDDEYIVETSDVDNNTNGDVDNNTNGDVNTDGNDDVNTDGNDDVGNNA